MAFEFSFFLSDRIMFVMCLVRIVWILEILIVASLVLPVVVLALAHLVELRLQLRCMHGCLLVDEAMLRLVVRYFDCVMLYLVVVVLLMCRHRLVMHISVCDFVGVSDRHIVVNVAMDLVMWGWVDFVVDYWMHIVMDDRMVIIVFNNVFVLMLMLFLGFAHLVLLFQLFVKFMLLSF